MNRNVCGLDRTVRLVGGTALAIAAFVVPRLGGESRGDARTVPGWRILAGYAAFELLVTGLLQWCPGNYLLGIDTCEENWRTALRTARRRLPVPS